MKFNFTAHVLTCAFFLAGCSDPAAEPSIAVVPPPPTAPESLRGHFCFETTQLGPLRSAVDTPALAAMIPSSARDFVASQFEDAAAAATVNESSRVCGLALGEEVIVAAETTPVSPHPFDTWHGDARHFGSVAVFGPREAVEEAGAYLARVLFAAESEAPLTIHVEDGVVAELRSVLDENLASASESARASADAEQASRGSEADFGDPQAFVRVVERRVRGLLQWLPDVGGVRVDVRAQGGAIQLDAHIDVRAGSPLASFLDDAPTREASFDRLPLGTALAYARAGEGESVFAALVEVAGARASSDEAQALMVLAEEMPSPFTLALGTTGETSQWLEYAGEAPPADVVQAALAGRYLRSLTSMLFDCPRPPRSWPAEASDGRCRLPPLRIRDDGIALGHPPREVVGANPDIARLMADAPAMLGGVYLDVLRLPAALALFTSLDPHALSEDRAAPLVGTLHYEARTLNLRVRCAPGSVANAVDVALSLVL